VRAINAIIRSVAILHRWRLLALAFATVAFAPGLLAAASTQAAPGLTLDGVVMKTGLQWKNVKSGLCLSPAGGGANNNDTIVQYNCDNDPSRR